MVENRFQMPSSVYVCQAFRDTCKILCILQQMTVHVIVTVGVCLY